MEALKDMEFMNLECLKHCQTKADCYLDCGVQIPEEFLKKESEKIIEKEKLN